MSRLDSVIRRLEAQRACLDLACNEVSPIVAGDPDAVVLELGLGNGRTFDHLRERIGAERIYVFDRQVLAHPDCVPERTHLFLGDVEKTLPEAAARLGANAVLVHSDIGTGDARRNAALASRIAALLPALLRPGALIVSDQDLPIGPVTDLPLPAGVKAGRYFLRRFEGEPAG